MYYKSSGMTFPTGDELKQMKTNILDDLVRVEVLSKKAKEDNLSPDETMTSVDVETMISSLKTALGDSDYQKILNDYNTNDESYAGFLADLTDKMAYASVVEKNFRAAIKENPQAELDKVVGSIGGEEVTRDLYNFQLANQELVYFYSNQQAMPIDEESMEPVNEAIFNKLAENKVLMAYGQENDITIDEAEVSDYQSAQEAFIANLFPEDESFQQYLDSKFLTVDQFNTFVKEEARVSATALAIQNQLKEDIDIKDSEIKSYYDKNKEAYDESSVSAQHILANDQELSDQIYEEAKDIKTKEAFTALIEKYKDVEGIQEATDLGTFGPEKMVAEFSDQAFSMDVNTASEPVKTEYGYHIIFVYDKNEGAIPSLDEKEDEIRELLIEQKTAEAFTKLEEKLMKKEKIDIGDVNDPFVSYIEELKTEMNVKIYTNRIK